MVGGLVEHHGLGILEQHPDEVDATSLSSREAVQVLEEEILTETQAVGEASHLRLSFVATGGTVLLFEIGESVDVVGGGVLGHLRPSRVQVLIEYVESPSGEDVTEPNGLEAETPFDGNLGQEPERRGEGRTPRRAHVRPGLAEDD